MAKVTRDQLYEVARLCGHGEDDLEALVDTAVDERLLPKAERGRGRGRGKGSEWVYPEGTDRSLEALLRLQNRGYRGKELRFALWWLGLRPWSGEVGDYIYSVFQAVAKIVRSRLGDLLKRNSVAMVETGTLDPDEVAAVPSIADVLSAELDAVFNRPMLRLMESMTSEIDPEHRLDLDEIRQIAEVGYAAAAGVYPEEIEATAFQPLEKYFQSGVPRDPIIEKVLSSHMAVFHSPDWLADTYHLLDRATVLNYESVRADLRRAGIAIRIVGTVGKVSRALRPKMSVRQRHRLGPVAKPTLAARAVAVGSMVTMNTRIALLVRSMMGIQNQTKASG